MNLIISGILVVKLRPKVVTSHTWLEIRSGGDAEFLTLVLVRLSFDDAASAELLIHVTCW